MSFTSWLRDRTHSAYHAPRRSPLARRQRAGFRSRLEALEDRSLMSGLPFPTVATSDQLVADINYADTTGGAFTINLQPSANLTVSGALPSTFPVGGSTKSVDLTVLGNGDTISGYLRLFTVAPGSSLTLDHVTLQGNWSPSGNTDQSGGAIYNQGTVTVTNGSALVGNGTGLRGDGGAIFNDGGTVTIANGSTLSGNSTNGGNGGGIYN